ncbi:hypothetical protein J1N35_028497, partial [Gossypium stocksii]
MASRIVAKDITTPRGSAAICLIKKKHFCLTFCTIDPEESFAKVKKYGLPQDEGVKSFISNPTAQLSVKLKCRRFCSVSREQRDKEIMREIQAIMTQIASTITYLPCLDEP